MASKLDALAAEYGHLLSSQLESQRAWYDARQAKAVAAAEAGCAWLVCSGAAPASMTANPGCRLGCESLLPATTLMIAS